MNCEHHQEWFVAVNPEQTVPTLVETDGRTLWDSHAISTYLIGRYGGANHPLYPSDLFKRALIDERLYAETAVAYMAIDYIIGNTFDYNGAHEVNFDQTAAVQRAYEMMEAFLINSDYVAGNSMTVADLSTVTVITQLLTLVNIDDDEFPKMQAWIKRMEQLPYYHEINTKSIEDFQAISVIITARNRATKTSNTTA